MHSEYTEPSQIEYIKEANGRLYRFYHDLMHSQNLALKAKEIRSFIEEKEIIANKGFLDSLEKVIYYAGLYHDIYQLNVDGKINDEEKDDVNYKRIEKYIIDDGDNITLKEQALKKNTEQLLSIFQKDNGKLSSNGSGGTNEFLSALHAVLFENNLNEQELLIMSAIIESTRPFQNQNRIVQLVERLEPYIDECDEKKNMLSAIAVSCTMVSNFDAENFKEKFSIFWDNSVKLFKERKVDFTDPERLLITLSKEKDFFYKFVCDDVFHSDSGLRKDGMKVKGFIDVEQIRKDNETANNTIEKYGLALSAFIIATKISMQSTEATSYSEIDSALTRMIGPNSFNEVRDLNEKSSNLDIRREVASTLKLQAIQDNERPGLQRLAANLIANLSIQEIKNLTESIERDMNANVNLEGNDYLEKISNDIRERASKGHIRNEKGKFGK